MMSLKNMPYKIRIMLTVVITFCVCLLSFWCAPDNQINIMHVYFTVLIVYAVVMTFFCDIFFLKDGAPIQKSHSLTWISTIYLIFLIGLFALRLIFNLYKYDIYIFLITLLLSALHLSMCLLMPRAFSDIDSQEATLQDYRNVRLEREIALNGLVDEIGLIPSLKSNQKLLHQLELLSNAVRFSPEKEANGSAELTQQIMSNIETLRNQISNSDGNISLENVYSNITKIIFLTEKRTNIIKLSK